MSEDPKNYKKYILFAYDEERPIGGMGDVVGSYDTPEEATEAYLANSKWVCCDIVERDTWEDIPLTD